MYEQFNRPMNLSFKFSIIKSRYFPGIGFFCVQKKKTKRRQFFEKNRILTYFVGKSRTEKTIIEGFIKAFVDIKANLQTSVLKITVLSKLNI